MSFVTEVFFVLFIRPLKFIHFMQEKETEMSTHASSPDGQREESPRRFSIVSKVALYTSKFESNEDRRQSGLLTPPRFPSTSSFDRRRSTFDGSEGFVYFILSPWKSDHPSAGILIECHESYRQPRNLGRTSRAYALSLSLAVLFRPP